MKKMDAERFNLIKRYNKHDPIVKELLDPTDFPWI